MKTSISRSFSKSGENSIQAEKKVTPHRALEDSEWTEPSQRLHPYKEAVDQSSCPALAQPSPQETSPLEAREKLPVAWSEDSYLEVRHCSPPVFAEGWLCSSFSDRGSFNQQNHGGW